MLDGRWLVLPRHTQPEPDVKALLDQIRITLPSQPPPRIKSSQLAPTTPEWSPFVVKTFWVPLLILKHLPLAIVANCERQANNPRIAGCKLPHPWATTCCPLSASEASSRTWRCGWRTRRCYQRRSSW